MSPLLRKLAIPVEREAQREGIELGGVERHQRHDEDRRIEEEQHEARHRAARRASNSCAAPSARPPQDRAGGAEDHQHHGQQDEGKGRAQRPVEHGDELVLDQRAVEACRCLPPRMRGSMKDPATGTKISTAPAARPGSDSGSTRRSRMVRKGAPSERAASMNAFVDGLQRQIGCQDDIGQVGVDEPDHHRRVGEHEVHRHRRAGPPPACGR